jgi:hypothetical protein
MGKKKKKYSFNFGCADLSEDQGFSLYGYLVALLLSLILGQLVVKDISVLSHYYKVLEEQSTSLLTSGRWFLLLRYMFDKDDYRSGGAIESLHCYKRNQMPGFIRNRLARQSDVLAIEQGGSVYYYFIHIVLGHTAWVSSSLLAHQKVLLHNVCLFRCEYISLHDLFAHRSSVTRMTLSNKKQLVKLTMKTCHGFSNWPWFFYHRLNDTHHNKRL